MKRMTERGPVGAWLRRERDQRGWSVPQMLEHLAAADIVLNLSAYRDYESGGRVPGDQRLREMEAALGSKPAENLDAADQVAAAIDRQTNAITAILQALVDELHSVRSGEDERFAAMERAVEALGRSIVPAPAGGASEAPRARREPME